MTIFLPTVDLPHSLRPLRESYRFGCTKKQLIICKFSAKKNKKILINYLPGPEKSIFTDDHL